MGIWTEALRTRELGKIKARVVTRGFTQRKAIDYNETSAYTARSSAWHILMAPKGWYIYQIDFVAAYLKGDLRERIFMKQFRNSRSSSSSSKQGKSWQG